MRETINAVNADSLYQEGMSLLYAGRYVWAGAMFGRTIELDPRFARAYSTLCLTQPQS